MCAMELSHYTMLRPLCFPHTNDNVDDRFSQGLVMVFCALFPSLFIVSKRQCLLCCFVALNHSARTVFTPSCSEIDIFTQFAFSASTPQLFKLGKQKQNKIQS